eukprot:CAMPEP_0176025232 /NCGR_PEP_ID=MMETSP0120_2-20121206/12340_1 /TAXON_ID=160619 /ORGANISM="Kryptoperidinium foliaceum, Strain CCMP 1326" /LENGTH=612 /DNA_ID=CAMNT_0017358413 /DNA_START=42 /DNA_END=1881 /DNA_ORIENTATION=-
MADARSAASGEWLPGVASGEWLVGDADCHIALQRGAVVLRSAAIDRIGTAGAAGVPEAWKQKLRERDGEVNWKITFLCKVDLQRLAAGLRDGSLQWPGDAKPAAGADGSFAEAEIAIAAAQLLAVDEGRVSDGDAEAVYRIVLWPAGNHVRRALGLLASDFHITLGFRSRDVHGKSKGLMTLKGGVPAPGAALGLAALAKQIAQGFPNEAVEIAELAQQGAEAHGEADGLLVALEARCVACGRAQRSREVAEAANRLLAIDTRNFVGLRCKAIASMALKRYSEGHSAIQQLEALLAGASATDIGENSVALRKWLASAAEKCRENLSIAEKLFPGAEDFANEAGDDDFEAMFLTNGSKLKFPSTAHLKNLGAATRDDKLCDEGRRKQFCGGLRVISVEEKVDGANLGLSLDSAYRVRMQARSKLVNWKTDPQFAGLEAWLKENSSTLCEVLERNNDIMFGEWCAYRHTVKYNSLPGYFLAFDIYDKRQGRFLSRESFHTRLARAGGPKIPAVPLVSPPRVFANEQEVEALLQRQSYFGAGPLEGVYLRIDEVSPAPGSRESFLVDRCKLVRPEFQQAIEEEGSWRGRGKNELDMAVAAAYTEQCYPLARKEGT